MASCLQLATWLSEAEQALHDVTVGGKIVEIQDQNLEKLTYSRANVGALRQYVADLRATIATQCGGKSLAQSYGPLRPFF